jgi:hypothetical protein
MLQEIKQIDLSRCLLSTLNNDINLVVRTSSVNLLIWVVSLQ